MCQRRESKLASTFSYKEAFSRNIGWVTAAEQELLRRTKVGIAGLGGVGGTHLLTLARLGIGRFHVADFDIFDVANFNRQAGARMATLGKPKVDVLAEMTRDINPEVDITCFAQGVTRENLDAFFAGLDVYVDGLDFFAFDAREMVFAECARRGVPAVTVAPLGMGAALLNFMPGGMTFEEYFGWQGRSDEERALRFFLGLSPAGLTRAYLVDPTAVDFKGRRGPSTPMACELCGGVAATEVLKIVLKRGKVWAAPHAIQYDAYRNKLARTWRPGGHKHPIQRLALRIARRRCQVPER